jgi:predicted DNA-binding protein (MmcQ/YjbR family)
MNIEEYRLFCLSLPGTTEDFPFDETTLVFRVGGKIYALADITTFGSMNLKSDPEKAIQWRELYSGVTPGYHMNKKHWNTVSTDGSVPVKVLWQMIRDSYKLVHDSLPKSIKSKL